MAKILIVEDDDDTRELITQLARIDHTNEYVLLFKDPELRERTVAETGVQAAANFSTHMLPHGLFSPLGQLSTRSSTVPRAHRS